MPNRHHTVHHSSHDVIIPGRALIEVRDHGRCGLAHPLAHPQGTPKDIVWEWNESKDARPRGAPVTLFEAPDGSVLMTEDINGTLLRLARAD